MTTQTLPKVIGGDIPVTLVEQGRDTPWFPRLNMREGLTLPRNFLQEFRPLSEGQQCLIRVKQTAGDPRFFFAGRDNDPKSLPFITGVDNMAYDALKRGGESAFFDALTPDLIKECGKLFPDSVRRQGDIWVAKIATSWEGLEPFVLVTFPKAPTKPVDVVAKPILSTRHTCTGKFWTFQAYSILERTIRFRERKAKKQPKKLPTQFKEVDTKTIVLMQGILEAPDHSPVDASDGVYAVARTPHLLPTPAWIGHSA